MLDLLRSVLAMVFVFGVVVFAHELGHFVAAKLVGVYAPRFSIGFGPTLFSRKWGETEYILAALPLGGYVRMASREDQATAFLEGGPEQTPETVGGSGVRVTPQGEPSPAAVRGKYYDPNALEPFGPRPVPHERLFESKSLAARLLIMVAGVTMNMVLAIIVLTAVSAIYASVPRTRTIGRVLPVAAAPQIAALTAGDSIVRIDRRAVADWGEIQDAILDGRGDAVRITTQRGEIVVPVGRPGNASREEITGSIQRIIPPVVQQVLAGKPAKRAGLLAGDSIAAIDGHAVRGWGEVVTVIEASPGRVVRFEVERAGARQALVITPDSVSEVDRGTKATRVIGRIGAAVRPDPNARRVPLGDALTAGWTATWEIARAVVTVLRDLLIGRASPRELGGIIQIASESSEAAKVGFDMLLVFLAQISVNLAVFNLLPIPILDGGQIVLNVAEAARGRAFSDRTRQVIAYVGLATIAILVVFALVNDVARRWL